MSIAKRLKHLDSTVGDSYTHIWDCCCDHGLLGAALLERQAAPNIHFVDIVPEIMRPLENKLAHFFPKNVLSNSHSQWHVHCMDVAELSLQKLSGKHLVIIAGVGGELMTEFVRAIHQNNLNAEIDFLLCPVHHQFTVRQLLIQLNYSLITEALQVENQRFYEVLLISNKPDSSSTISPVGSFIWQANTPDESTVAASYLSKTLSHYKRIQLGHASNVQDIINAYSVVDINVVLKNNP